VSDPRHIEISALAAAQVRRAETWWQLNRPKAPGAIRAELERASSLIALQPKIGTLARNITLPGVRRLHLGRIRYDLYYRLVEAPGRLEILAFWHASRRSLPPL
jgi:plasmid stabilization system protein ParE